MPCSSGVTFPSACNCGRRVFTREDPFTLEDANFAFYAECEEECCRDLDSIEVPHFKRQLNDVTAKMKKMELSDEDSEFDEEEANTLEELAVGKGSDRSRNRFVYPFCLGLSRQSSSLEPVDYMLTENFLLSSKVPAFPSWSLVLLGSSYIYSHNTGVSQVRGNMPHIPPMWRILP